MAKVLKFKSLGNDLYCDVGECKCPSKNFVGTSIEHIMKKKISLTGYSDANFFDNVNKEPREYKCAKCELSFMYQWKRDGVHINQ